jgi:CMP/dCMP kinase
LNVVISGLTAAGKTTHAYLLAEHLGLQYVSASRVLAARAGLEVNPEHHWWLDAGGRLSSARAKSNEPDTYVDRVMVQLAEERDGQVFDAWALAWTRSAPMLRIWLASDEASRYRKCHVSHLADRSLPLEECQRIVDAKDDESRRIFLRLHGFDLYRDHDVFDMILDLSDLIPEATPACSRQSVARADAYLQAVVAAVTGTVELSSDDILNAASALPPNAIIKIPPLASPDGA